MKKKILIIISLLFLFILFFVYGYIRRYIKQFANNAAIPAKNLFRESMSGIKNPYQQEYLTFLILGLDKREGEDTLLTDTILLTTINTKTGNYLLFSLPRDLWLDDLQTKINALYYYGGSQLVEEKLENILAWKINYVVALQMEQIKELVDLFGGVEVEVERSFVDEEFPADDNQRTIRIAFQAGRQILNGERALQFMRSRKSKDLIEGTDEARQKRQKKVILALKEKLLSAGHLAGNPEVLAKLYLFLNKGLEVKPVLDLKEIFSFWKVGKAIILGGKQKELEIPWRGEQAILIPARDPIYNTWILEPKNNNWELIKNYFHQSIPR